MDELKQAGQTHPSAEHCGINWMILSRSTSLQPRISRLPDQASVDGCDGVGTRFDCDEIGNQLVELGRVGLRVRATYSCSWETHSELRGDTSHMVSHSVTCHPTQVNAPRLNSSQ